VVIPVAPAFSEYAENVAKQLEEAGFRASADVSDDRMNAKIRYHQSQKVPYMLIVGENEVEAGAVSYRTRTNERANGIPFEDFKAYLRDKVETKAEI